MEAITFEANNKSLKFRTDFPKPEITNDRQVLVKIAYSGVCGTDLHIIQGEFPVIDTKPLVLGHEFSGVVEEAGAATSFKKGQKVAVDPNRTCRLCNPCRIGRYNLCIKKGKGSSIGTWIDGGWAEYMVFREDQVYLLPDDVSLEEGALCEPYSCVAHGFYKASPISVGEKILVIGAGIIGNLWLTTLHHHGHRDVTVSEMNEIRLEAVKKLETGYRLIAPDVLEKEDELYDVIIDCTGVAKVLESSFNYLSTGGKYVVFGCCNPQQKVMLSPFDIFNKELNLIGVKVNPYTFQKSLAWLQAMGPRYLNYEKLGIKIYKLSEYETAIDDLKKGVVSKAMFKIHA